MNKRQVFKERLMALKKDIHGKYSDKRYVEQRLQPDNTVKIDVNIPDDLELFDPLAPDEYAQLNPEILRYIEDQAYFVPAEYDLTINFVGKSLPQDKRTRLENALHDHYNMQVYDKLDDIKNNRRLGIFLLAFGAIALGVYFFMTLFEKNLLFNEIVSIVGTFSVWEAVDCWLIGGHHTKTELRNAMQMALLKVTFTEKELPREEQPQCEEQSSND